MEACSSSTTWDSFGPRTFWAFNQWLHVCVFKILTCRVRIPIIQTLSIPFPLLLQNPTNRNKKQRNPSLPLPTSPLSAHLQVTNQESNLSVSKRCRSVSGSVIPEVVRLTELPEPRPLSEQTVPTSLGKSHRHLLEIPTLVSAGISCSQLPSRVHVYLWLYPGIHVVLTLIAQRCLKIRMRRIFADWVKGRFKISFKTNYHPVCNLWRKSELINIQFPTNPSLWPLCPHRLIVFSLKQQQ